MDRLESETTGSGSEEQERVYGLVEQEEEEQQQRKPVGSNLNLLEVLPEEVLRHCVGMLSAKHMCRVAARVNSQLRSIVMNLRREHMQRVKRDVLESLRILFSPLDDRALGEFDWHTSSLGSNSSTVSSSVTSGGSSSQSRSGSHEITSHQISDDLSSCIESEMGSWLHRGGIMVQPPFQAISWQRREWLKCFGGLCVEYMTSRMQETQWRLISLEPISRGLKRMIMFMSTENDQVAFEYATRVYSITSDHPHRLVDAEVNADRVMIHLLQRAITTRFPELVLETHDLTSSGGALLNVHLECFDRSIAFTLSQQLNSDIGLQAESETQEIREAAYALCIKSLKSPRIVIRVQHNHGFMPRGNYENDHKDGTSQERKDETDHERAKRLLVIDLTGITRRFVTWIIDLKIIGLKQSHPIVPFVHTLCRLMTTNHYKIRHKGTKRMIEKINNTHGSFFTMEHVHTVRQKARGLQARINE